MDYFLLCYAMEEKSEISLNNQGFTIIFLICDLDYSEVQEMHYRFHTIEFPRITLQRKLQSASRSISSFRSDGSSLRTSYRGFVKIIPEVVPLQSIPQNPGSCR